MTPATPLSPVWPTDGGGEETRVWPRYRPHEGNAMFEGGTGGPFTQATLNPGETFETTVYFDVPDDSGQIAYMDYPSGRVLAAWKY